MLNLRVRSIVNEAVDINSFELVHPRGEDLPPFTAGSHIDVAIPGGIVRQYSLCNDPRERSRYVIAVLKVRDGRGGSRAMHEAVRAGDEVTVSTPRNNFELVESARRHLLIAGGIGITPLMAMVERLDALGADYALHYCTRSPEQAAFNERLAERVRRQRVIYHYDGGDPSKGLRVSDVVANYEPGTHLYYCGPPGLMAAIGRETGQWPHDSVHCEFFVPPPTSWPLTSAPAASAEYRSIVEVLRGAGIECSTSCEAGVCGTCRTRYLEGTPDHHDFVLNDTERENYVMICCARASSEVLVLDI
jgi:ferredoxin-NADP reductase